MELRMTQRELDEALKDYAENPEDSLEIVPATVGYVLLVSLGNGQQSIGIRIVPEETR